MNFLYKIISVSGLTENKANLKYFCIIIIA